MNNSIDLVASPFSSNSDSIEELSGKPNASAGAAAAARGRAQSQSGKLIDPAIAVANKGIEELNNIDENISSLLLSAGLAIKTLTTPTSLLQHNSQDSSTPATTNTSPPTLENQQASFKAHASEFYRLLDSIRVDLRRQILLQDQAEILAPLPTSSTTVPGGANASTAGPSAGGFDVGLLNIRSDNVGKDMEEELWTKARTFMDNLERAKEAAEAERQLLRGNGNGNISVGDNDGDIDMTRTNSLPGGDEILRF